MNKYIKCTFCFGTGTIFPCKTFRHPHKCPRCKGATKIEENGEQNYLEMRMSIGEYHTIHKVPIYNLKHALYPEEHVKAAAVYAYKQLVEGLNNE